MNLRTHHSALRPTAENFDRTVQFYTDILGFQTDKAWTTFFNQGKPMKCAMIHPGDGIMIEIFGGGQAEDGLAVCFCKRSLR